MKIVIIFTVFYVVALTWARPSHDEDKQSLVNVVEGKIENGEGGTENGDQKEDDGNLSLVDIESFENYQDNEKHADDGDSTDDEGISKNDDEVDHILSSVDITDEQAIIENGEGGTENKDDQKEDDGDVSLVDIVSFENDQDNEKHTDDGDSIENEENSMDRADDENGLDVVDEQEPEVEKSSENGEDAENGADLVDINPEDADENGQAAKDEEHQESREDGETLDDILGDVNETGTQDQIEKCLWHLFTFVMSVVNSFVDSLNM